MKLIYPAIFYKTDDKVPYFVEIPDFDKATQGETLENAIEMAREIICIEAIELQRSGKKLPASSDIESLKTDMDSAIITLVDADVDGYKRRMENRCMRKNCTVPIWLNDEAEKAGLNFSSALQLGLKIQLGINLNDENVGAKL